MNSSENAPGAASFMDRNYFLLRRLHSLTGIVPIGVFLCVHLLTNSSVLWGAVAERGGHTGGWREGGVAYFTREVVWINEQIPHLLLIEITLWASIIFHSVLGIYYAASGKSNVSRYSYQGNWRYSLQRISGYVGVAFILYHVGTLRWGWTFLVPGGTEWSYQFAASTLAATLRGGNEGFTLAGVVVSLFYMISVGLLVFHFANGLWTAAITWGLTVSDRAQRRWGVVCAGVGAALLLMGWGSVLGYALLDPTKARAVEEGAALPHDKTVIGPDKTWRGNREGEHPLAEPGYPWPGTETAVTKESQEGPLQR
ncbi:MAG: hypothetical protein AMXMBFR58_26060 [Phycisphaerae bacterium]